MQPQLLAVPPGPSGLSESRGFIHHALSVAGFDEQARYQVTVATNEAVSNAMEHGAPCDDGRFHLAASVEAGSFIFSIRDCGRFQDAASTEPDPVAERGRGFAFMNLLMDDVQVDARPGETVLRLAKRLPDTPPPAHEADGSAIEDNVRVVRELFEAFAARDLARTSRLVDRGVVFEPLSTLVERRAPYLGVSGVHRYFAELDDSWQEFEVRVDELRGEGNYVVAFGRIHARQANVVADDPAGFAFRLRNTRVVWGKVFGSQDEALAAAGWT